MRIRCPACGAPYIVPGEQPPDGTQCPNCDAPAPRAVAIPVQPPRNPSPEPEGNSRVVTVVALLHLLVAATGLCVFVGMSVVMGERGSDRESLWRAFGGGFFALLWAATGIGILRRWIGAWMFSLALVGFSFLALVLGAKASPLGAICHGVLFVGILFVLIGRRGEFR